MNLYVISVIGNYSLPEVTNDEIEQIIQKKTVAGKHGTARSIRSMLKVVLDYAVEKKFIATNPVASIKYYNIRPKTDRDRFLNEQEIGEFLNLVYSTDNIHVKYKIAIHLLLMLLLRKTELIHAKWEQVDFNKQTFTLYTSKTNAQLVILLPTQAITVLEILKAWSLEANCLSDYIFSGFINHNVPIHENSLNKHVGVINKKMFGNNNDKYFTIHDLRRTGTTHLSEMEYDSDYIEVALNHKKTGIKKVYHRSKHINTRKKMLQVWADEIYRLIGKELLPYDHAVGA